MPNPPAPLLREMIMEAEKEREQLDTESREIDILVKQTANEIDKLQQRQSDAVSRLRQVEANFEAYSHTDIRDAYTGVQDAQMRVFMMRSQLEQFQNKQRSMQRLRSQLEKLSLLASQIAESVPSETEKEQVRHGGESQAIVQIIQAQEDERRIISRQMHDGPAQSLTNLILQAEIVERLFDTDASRARAELSNLKASANATFQRIRDFIFNLRPMMLDDLGLLPTLKRYMQSFESKSRLSVSLDLRGERSLSPHIEVTLFRIIQELLSNVARHAHASRAQVILDLQSEPIVVAVEDDGSGFDVDTVMKAVHERGSSGLANLENRIEMLGGRLQLQSATGRGTKVRVELAAA